MSTQRPDVTDEDLGIRTFQLRKAKAVERAIDRVRHAHKDDWTKLTNQEIESFEWVLGEIWAHVSRDTWDEMRFGKITLRNIRAMIASGRDLRKHARPSMEVLDEAAAMIPNTE